METLIKTLKHIFIPHKGNNYKPHFLREVSVVSITVISIALLIFSASSISYINKNNMTATVLPAVLVDLTNDARNSNNEQNLTRNPVLDKVAKLKAEDMARLGYFAHTSPSGVTPWHWFDKAGYYFAYAGENLAINFTESVDVENAWLNSPTHKANILNSHFTEIGIAAVDGVYQGQPTTYVVQEFGTPALSRPVEKSEEGKILDTSKSTNIDKQEITKKTPTTLASSIPAVKGESITKNQNLETVVNNKDFISVKNLDAVTNADKAMIPESNHYATWKQRLLFALPAYTDTIYHILILIVFFTLLAMTIIEIKIQHPKNIMYGVFLIVIMTCLVYLNGSVFLGRFI